MNHREILSIQMEYHFGFNAKRLLKRAVNAAMDAGEWHENFDIAVTQAELDEDQAEKLLVALLDAYPSYVLDVDGLKAIIDRHLPQAALTSIAWLVGSDCALVLTDSLRVAKVAGTTLAWVTKRVSWDGIILNRVEENIVFGSWYDVTKATDKWQPLRISYSNGKLLEGMEIE